MDLNEYQHFAQIDREDMLGHIMGLPLQLEKAWHLGKNQPLTGIQPVERIILAGMGGSAIGGDLLASYAADQLEVPFIVHRDYDLPACASGAGTLVVASSHSGNTEEVLSAFERALKNKCQLIVVCTGGKLEALAREHHVPLWKFEHHGQPRAAVGYSFGLLLALLTRLGLLPDPEREVRAAIKGMRALQEKIDAPIPVLKNPAKRLAGQLIGRHITVFSSGFMSPVARRWKTQLNEVAKAFASFEHLPEADHNTLTGIWNPPGSEMREFCLFLLAGEDHPRNLLRLEDQTHPHAGRDWHGSLYRRRRNTPRANVERAALWRLPGVLPGDDLRHGPYTHSPYRRAQRRNERINSSSIPADCRRDGLQFIS